MRTREYAAGVLALLSDPTVASQTLVVSAILDAVTHRPEPQWSSLQNAGWQSGNRIGGYAGGGGAPGPEVLTWQQRAFGYCGGRHDEKRCTVEVGLHTQFEFDLAPVASAVGLELSRNPDALRYGIGPREFGFPDFDPSDENVRMLALWLHRTGMGEPLGASGAIAGRMIWVRRHWRLKPRTGSLWEMMTGGKTQVNNHIIETDLLTWKYNTGDATTQFVARPVQPSTADGQSCNENIDAARKLAERVRVTLCHTPVNGEALRRRLSGNDRNEGVQP